jgi:ATP-binding cassette subfamily A (ABC1) protein 3
MALGANGAGKSTIMSMLTREVLPTSGTAYLGGFPVLQRFASAGACLGVVHQRNILWDSLTPEENLILLALVRGFTVEEANLISDFLLRRLRLEKHRQKLTSELSGGSKRKLCVALSLVGAPTVVCLDEPCAGLDPLSRRALRSIIRSCMSGKAVVLTTHSMVLLASVSYPLIIALPQDEADALCGKLAIMVNGQFRSLGSRQQLKASLGPFYQATVLLLSGLSDAQLEEAELQVTRTLLDLFPGTMLLSNNGRSSGRLLRYRLPQLSVRLSAFFRAMEVMRATQFVEHYTLDQPSLEDAFLETLRRTTAVADGRPLLRATEDRGENRSGAIATEGEEEEEHNLTTPGRYDSFGLTEWMERLVVIFGSVLTLLFLGLCGALPHWAPGLFSVAYTSAILALLAAGMLTWRRVQIKIF